MSYNSDCDYSFEDSMECEEPFEPVRCVVCGTETTTEDNYCSKECWYEGGGH